MSFLLNCYEIPFLPASSLKYKLMKQLLIVCTCLCVSVLVRAQIAKYDTNRSIPFDGSAKLKVSLTNDRLTIVYNNQEVPGATPQALDSLLKKEPDLKNFKIDFEGTNADPEKKKAVEAVLKQCECHVARRMISMQKN